MKTKAANEKCVKLQLLTQKFISSLFDKEKIIFVLDGKT